MCASMAKQSIGNEKAYNWYVRYALSMKKCVAKAFFGSIAILNTQADKYQQVSAENCSSIKIFTGKL